MICQIRNPDAIYNDIIESISSQGFSTTFTKNKIFILGLPIWKEMYYNDFRCSFNIFYSTDMSNVNRM